MFELTAAVGDLSTPVKVGWTIWLAWGVVALGWYRHARAVDHAAPAMPNRVTPMLSADAEPEPHEEDPTYSEPAYGDHTGSSYSDATGSSYNDSNEPSSRNY